MADVVVLLAAGLALLVVVLLVMILVAVRRPKTGLTADLAERLATLQMLPGMKESADQRLPAIEKTTDTLSQLMVASTQARVQEEKTVRETLKVLHESTRHTPALATKVAVLENELKRLQSVEMGVRELQNLFLSVQGRGAMGEEAIRNQFHALPHEMWAEQFPLGAGRVDFVVHMPNKRMLPIDSKTSGLQPILDYYGLGQKAANAATPEEKEVALREQGKIQTRIRQAILTKTYEVAAYIQPESGTLGIAIQAVPDSVYSILDVKTRKEASEQNVQIVPYGLLLPVVHMLRSQNQYDKLDLQSVVAAMHGIRLQTNVVRDVLKNKFETASKYLQSGITDVRDAILAIDQNAETVSANSGAPPGDERGTVPTIRTKLRQKGLIEST